MLQELSDRSNPLVIGTRASLLARSQTGWVVETLKEAHPGLQIRTDLIRSSGDVIQDRPLYEFGGKGLFTKELEIALLQKAIDVAVHSMKDVPVTMPLVQTGDLIFAAIPQREDPRDALVSRKPMLVQDLPAGARVGTGSLRRRCQLLQARPDLVIEPIRGNIDTRLKKLREGQFDAIVLAMAGIKRAHLWNDAEMAAIPVQTLVPSAGQGALALQCRVDDAQTRELLSVMDDPTTHACVEAERALVLALNGDCHSPIGAWARMEGGTMAIDAAVGASDGHPPVRRAQVRVASLGQVDEAVKELAGMLR